MKTLTKCHKTTGEVANGHVRRACRGKTEVDKKTEHFKPRTKYTKLNGFRTDKTWGWRECHFTYSLSSVFA